MFEKNIQTFDNVGLLNVLSMKRLNVTPSRAIHITNSQVASCILRRCKLWGIQLYAERSHTE